LKPSSIMEMTLPAGFQGDLADCRGQQVPVGPGVEKPGRGRVAAQRLLIAPRRDGGGPDAPEREVAGLLRGALRDF
jgi:hypothetical protein